MPKKGRARNRSDRKNEQAPSKVKRAEERKQKRLAQAAEQAHHPDADAAVAGPSGIGDNPGQAQQYHDPVQDYGHGVPSNSETEAAAGPSGICISPGQAELFRPPLQDRAVLLDPAAPSVQVEEENVSHWEDLTMPVRVVGVDKQVQFSPTMAMKEIQTSVTQTSIGVQADQRRESVTVQTSKLQFLIMKYHNMTSDEKFACLLYSRLKKTLPKTWVVTRAKEKVHLILLHEDSVSIKNSISFFDNQIFIRVLGHPLKYVHSLWDKINFEFQPDLLTVCSTLVTLAGEIENMKECCGCSDLKYLDMWSMGAFAKRGAVEFGSIGKKLYRSNNCELLLSQSSVSSCSSCRSEQAKMASHFNRAKKREANRRDEAKINIQYMERNQLARALIESRTLNSKFKMEVLTLKKRVDHLISEEGVSIKGCWSQDFININKKNFEKMSPLQKLFWDQQMKAASLKNAASMKWHPMIIRMALNFQMVSTAGFENMRNSGFLTLPCKRTLYDYSHVTTAKEGCQEDFLKDVSDRLKSTNCEDHERFVCMMFDEMHIRANLVYSKTTGELIGFVNLDAVESEFENLQAEWTGQKRKPQLAKRVLVYMIKNISANDPQKIIKNVVAVYSTINLSAASLYKRTWEVIYKLESYNIPVLVVTCDGAAINKKFINMHSKFDKSVDVVYSTTNLAAPDRRPLFFVIDPPHVLKTSRNCFANSGSHRKSRNLWKNNEEIRWNLIESHYHVHKADKFRKAILNRACVYLTSFSTMNVSYAAKVLSKTLASSIETDALQYAAEGKQHLPYKEAVKFMVKMNDFFDCLNGHNVKSHIRYRNENLRPYEDSNDPRFDSLQDFLNYFEEWQREVNARPGRFSKKSRSKMTLSHQTVSSLRITVHAAIGAMRFLLNKGAKQICARRLCQDPLEQMFSIYRRKGGSNKNPDLNQVLQSSISVHAQRELALPSQRGNTQVVQEDLAIDPTPLPKRRKSEGSED